LFRPRERAFKQFKYPRPQCVKPAKKLRNPLHCKESRRNTEGGTAEIGVSADVDVLNYLLLSI